MREYAPQPETDEANEAAVKAARDAYRHAYEQGMDSGVASCADWFGWHAAIKAARAQFATEDRDLLAALRKRLGDADATLAPMQSAAYEAGDTPNEARLMGKRETARLAISYLDELVRGL